MNVVALKRRMQEIKELRTDHSLCANVIPRSLDQSGFRRKSAPHAALTGYRFTLRETRQNGKIKIESRGSVPI
jgi:hypothetical protein